MIKQAVTLIRKVPYGNFEPIRLDTSDPTQYLAIEPIAPPIAMYKYFCNAPPFKLLFYPAVCYRRCLTIELSTRPVSAADGRLAAVANCVQSKAQFTLVKVAE